jgi:hypothetical protein
MIFPILIVYTQIGIQPYCTLNKQDKKIECNYESKEACEGYRESNEICIENPKIKHDIKYGK